MFRMLRRHLPQLSLYALSGGTSAFVELSTYLLLFAMGMWYVAASMTAWGISYATAFLMHKYLVFQKEADFLKHLRRHLTLECCNLVVGTCILYLLVDRGGIDEEPAKVLSMAIQMGWNFLIMKFLVFV